VETGYSVTEVKIPHAFFPMGTLALLGASIIGLYLAYRSGWPVMLFVLLGFLGAYFYLGPPLR